VPPRYLPLSSLFLLLILRPQPAYSQPVTIRADPPTDPDLVELQKSVALKVSVAGARCTQMRTVPGGSVREETGCYWIVDTALDQASQERPELAPVQVRWSGTHFEVVGSANVTSRGYNFVYNITGDVDSVGRSLKTLTISRTQWQTGHANSQTELKYTLTNIPADYKGLTHYGLTGADVTNHVSGYDYRSWDNGTLWTWNVDVKWDTGVSPFIEVIFVKGSNPPASGDLAITGISLVQVVHNLTELPLIAGRTTLARVFIRSIGPNAAPVNGVSAVLRGPSAPDPPPLSGPITATPYNGPIPPTAAPAPDDFLPGAAVDFIVPDAWVKTPGPLTLTAEIVAPPGFQDSDLANNKLQRTATLIKPPQSPQSKSPPGVFRIGYITIDHQPPGAAAPFTVTPGIGARLGNFIQREFPVPDGGIEVSRILKLKNPYRGAISDGNDTKALVTRLRYVFGGEGFDQVIGIYPRTPASPGSSGKSDPIWLGGRGKVSLLKDQLSTAYGPAYGAKQGHYAAHEIGHNLGLRHPTMLYQGCDQGSDSCQPAFWPYPADPTIQFPGWTPQGVYIPKTRFDLMSYCANNDASNMWISPAYYKRLIDNNLAPADAPCPAAAGANAVGAHAGAAPARKPGVRSLAAAQGYLLVSGSVNAGGQSGRLHPALRLTTEAAPPASDPKGDYCLRFLGNAGSAGDHCFTLSFRDSDYLPLTADSFSFLLTPPAGATGIGLFHGGVQVAAISGGARPPTVSITSPKNGDRWSGAQNLTWTGSGSGSLTYLVDYSYDDGATWTPLSLDMTETTLPVEPGDLLGSPVYFRVQASDGFNTATAQVGPIQVTQTPQIAASPAALDFRNGLPGIGVERDLVLTATGSGPLRVTKVEFDNPAFTLTSPTVPFTLFAGDDITLQVRFAAASAGAAQGKMTITSNAVTTPSLVVPLTATGTTSVAPDAVVSPVSLDFGQVATGTTAVQTVTLQNFGPGQLQVNSVSVAGAGFTLAAGLPPTPFVLGIESIAIGVEFAPKQAGAQTGSLTISTSDPSRASLAVSLRGSGITGTVSCSYTLSPGTPNPPSFSATGGSGTALVTAAAGCAWSAVPSVTWIATTSSGSGNGAVNYTVAANAGATSRTGTITTGGATITVTQAGVSGGGTSLLTNPSFEQPGGSSLYMGMTGTQIPGWVVPAGKNVDYIGAYWTASDGRFSIDLDGTYSAGAIAQTFATTAGTPYTVTFDMAGNFEGPPAVKQMQVQAAGQTSTPFTFDTAGKSSSNMGWATKTWCFTASGASTTLEFRSLHAADNSWGPALDNVRVTAGCGGGVPSGANLIHNGDAEGNPGAGDCLAPASIAGWKVTGNATLCKWGGFAELGATDPGPTSRGTYVFSGGPDNAQSSLSQNIDVSAYAAAIDAGNTPYTLSGWLGGWDDDDDNATLLITFRSLSSTLGTAQIGPVLSTDRYRGSGLILKVRTGNVPAGARSIEVLLQFERMRGLYNDGAADNLSFTLGTSGGGMQQEGSRYSPAAR
jgi:choice-of-anchor C domain-containing protein